MTQIMKEKEQIGKLWDSITEEMKRIQDLLLEGKSELAALKMDWLIKLHNGQNREFIWEQLNKMKECQCGHK